jgi:hypothetical protein
MPTETHETIKDYVAPYRDAILPLIIPAADRIRKILQADKRYRARSGGETDNGPHLFVAGISAERLDFSLSHVDVAFGCVVTCIPGNVMPSLTMSVGWFRAYFQNHHAGFSVFESRLYCPRPTLTEAIDKVTQHLPICESRMREALRRGTLPGKFAHLLHRIVRHVPQASIASLNRGRIDSLPDVRTFAKIYDASPS